MTHIMVPDGVLPWWLSLAGWVFAVLLLVVALRQLRGDVAARTVPLVGVMTAFMVVAMSLELVPIGYEMHFTALTGMVIGPWYGAISALLFNLIRAFLGDGAFTNIGLNTTVTWVEIALGAVLFAALRPLARRRSPALAAGAAAFVSLLAATLVFLGIVAASTIDPAEAIHTGTFDVGTGQFREPFAAGPLGFGQAEGQVEHKAETALERAGLARFAAAMVFLGLIGWSIEAALTAAVASFVARVRPELLGLRVVD